MVWFSFGHLQLQLSIMHAWGPRKIQKPFLFTRNQGHSSVCVICSIPNYPPHKQTRRPRLNERLGQFADSKGAILQWKASRHSFPRWLSPCSIGCAKEMGYPPRPIHPGPTLNASQAYWVAPCQWHATKESQYAMAATLLSMVSCYKATQWARRWRVFQVTSDLSHLLETERSNGSG